MTTELEDIKHIANENGSNLSFLTYIIKANKLHEPNCVAFSLPKDHSGVFGFTAGMADDHCHCWLDKDTKAEPGKGFTWFHKESKEIFQTAYTNRYYTLSALLFSHPYLSRDKTSEEYWGKLYYLVEVSINSTESPSE